MTQDTYPEDYALSVYIFDGDVWDEFVTNDMHEAEVQEITEKLQRGETFQRQEEEA